MSLSAEDVKVLADAVESWRTRECISIAFYTCYVYYVLTTIAEEVSEFSKKKWNCGKTLFMVMRYGTIVFIAMELSREYRNYYDISPRSCKVLAIAFQGTRLAVAIACDLVLALCLGALLQAQRTYTIALTLVAAVPSTIDLIVTVASYIQYPGQSPATHSGNPHPLTNAVPAESIQGLEREMGYPCYTPSSEGWVALTISGVRRDVRQFVSFATTALLFVVAIVTIAPRYRGKNGRLVQVMRRDGGLYHLVLSALRFGRAMVNAPAILSISSIDGNSIVTAIDISRSTIIPILAQRLLLNMRKVTYVGSQPAASKLLFAALEQRPHDDFGSHGEDNELTAENGVTEAIH